MAVGDIHRLQMISSMDGDIMQNDLYYKTVVEPSSGTEENDLAEAFETTVVPQWILAVTGDVSLDCIRVQKVFPLPLRAVFDKFITAVGVAIGIAAPMAVAALIQKVNPALAGRGNKGRAFISGVAREEIQDGRITSLLEGLLIGLKGALTANITGPLSGEYNPVWATRSTVTPFPIIGSVDWSIGNVLPRVATQRRRKTPVRKIFV